VAPVGVEAELLGLVGGGLAELGAAVADVDAVERREPVEVALAVLVVDVAALAARDHGPLPAFGVGAHAREVHPEVALGQLLKTVGRAGERGPGRARSARSRGRSVRAGLVLVRSSLHKSALPLFAGAVSQG